ncbi:TIGR01777 family oxidoreductase [Enemella sp. A6]|uniref:TIGR01777 family oxidoreductase n=1 Tax=Enemella sp. A6 TaxID=3440152 RepID=UPI003EBEDDDD
MPTLVASTPLAHDRNAVFAWHERAGAFTRLTPPGFGRVESESPSLRPGATATMRINLPGPKLPIGRPVSTRWVARHVEYDPPRSFTDEMTSGPLRSWRHEHDFAEVDGRTLLIDRVSYELPRWARVAGSSIEQRLGQFFAYRGRALSADLDFHARYSGERRTVLIAGASGLVGSQLAALLSGGGHRVRRLVRGRTDPHRDEVFWDPEAGRFDSAVLDEVDVVINLAGHPIAGRFTPAHLDRVRRSRVASTALLAGALAERAADGRARALINASASGYYGSDRGDELLSEDAAPGTGPLAEIVRAWEEATRPAAEAGVRVACVRTGIVQSPAGGQLGLQLPLFTAALGGPLGDGRQFMPWLAIDDIAYTYAFLALTDNEGPFNAAAPGIVDGNTYARTLAEVVGRPAWVRVPKFAPALLLGKDGADDFALAGQRMVPERLTAAGFRFGYPNLADALRHVLATGEDGPTTVSCTG